MMSGTLLESGNSKLCWGFFVLFLTLQILGCSVNRHVYEKVDPENRWIRTYGDYQEFRFEQDQWIRITCWYHQLDDFTKGLEVGIVVPAHLLGNKGLKIHSLNFGDLEMSSFKILNSGYAHFRFLKIPESSNRDYVGRLLHKDTVSIRMGEELYWFVSSQD